MKTKIFSLLACVALMALIVGCVKTVAGGHTAAVPFAKDRIAGRYERSADEIFGAAKAVIAANGTLLKEGTLSSETNLVKTVEGKVNQRSVWVRIEQVDPKISAVTVQARTRAGGTDIDLAHDIEKQIALKLVR